MSALTLLAALAVAKACAAVVAPATLLPIALTESRLDPLAINDNTAGREIASATLADAVANATRLIAAGHNVDLGISQLNWPSDHLQSRGLGITDAFDPCTSLRVGAAVLANCWQRADGTGQTRLRSAIGCYNTGSVHRGAAYTGLVLASAVQIVPAIELSGAPAPSRDIAPAGPAPPPSWDVWATEEWQQRQEAPTPAPIPPATPTKTASAVETTDAVLLHASQGTNE